MGNRPSTPERHQLKQDILEKSEEFPSPLRQIIAQNQQHETEVFLEILEERVVDLMYSSRGRGLDSEKDTLQQVETAIRSFPHVLWDHYWGVYPPIYAQLCRFRSASFVPLFAKLGIEFAQFPDEERGGVLYRHWNVLRTLVNDDWKRWYIDQRKDPDAVEEKFLSVLRDLREMGILRDEDIREQELFKEMSGRSPFPGKIFRCLVDWYPNGFQEACTAHNQPSFYRIWIKSNDMNAFRVIFELGMKHFPTELAFLFHRDADSDNDGCTPFEQACDKFGIEIVTKMVEDALLSGNPLRLVDHDDDWYAMATEKGLLYAASHPDIHLDAVYFVLRRNPVLVSVSSRLPGGRQE